MDTKLQVFILEIQKLRVHRRNSGMCIGLQIEGTLYPFSTRLPHPNSCFPTPVREAKLVLSSGTSGSDHNKARKEKSCVIFGYGQ